MEVTNTGRSAVHIRPAAEEDRAFILGIVPRLRAFGPTPLRAPDAMDGAEREALARAMDHPSGDHVVLVAELDGIGPAGIAYAHESVDYFTGETHGHLGIIAVAAAGEGKGVGRALMDAVEAWSAARGHRFITLNVFAGNERARAVYERGGYEPDTLRYVKVLRDG